LRAFKAQSVGKLWPKLGLHRIFKAILVASRQWA